MIISHTHRFIFVHIHKTAGDSVSDALRPSLGMSDFIIRSDIQAWVRRHITRQAPDLGALKKHSPAVMIRPCVPEDVWQSYFKFAFVRNPLDRTASLYHYIERKVEERHKPLPRNLWYHTPPGRRSDPRNWRSAQAYAETSSFSEFIRHPTALNDLAMQPQALSVCDKSGKQIIDFIGRFETLAEDFDTVRRRLNLPAVSIEHKNSSRRSSGADNDSTSPDPTSPAGARDMSAEDVAYLSARFARDLDGFGYGKQT